MARTPAPGLVPLQFMGASPVPATLTGAVASTAVIFANSGEGSGFLISHDGYMLTNHHVVGGAQLVKVRWSDGTEVLGEVLRSDKPRDVALIKTDPKGRKPLALRGTPVAIGEDVYAIGAPTGRKFQNTVTKGIVSAMRLYKGHNFIQSDVGVTHGNSGGPIIDSKGHVVGLTDLGFDEAPMVNLFIPIAEAQSFLGLQQKPFDQK
ncbi:MAG: trypsin-like peptidase domain-containing protein [Rhizorhabdus sp.]